MKNKVVHCKKENFDIYIGRPSIWGNPFIIGQDGTRAEVISKYEEWIKEQPDLIKMLPTLKGKILGCWCKPKACHGDVLIRLAETYWTTQLEDLDEDEIEGEREISYELMDWWYENPLQVKAKCKYCENEASKTLVWLYDKQHKPAEIKLPWCGCDLMTALKKIWKIPYQVIEGRDYRIEND